MTMTEPTECPFGRGTPFTIVVPTDIETSHGNVSLPAGEHTAWESSDGHEGTVSVWSPDHYAQAVWVSVPPWRWHFPGEEPRPTPTHDCWDNLRSGVAGGIYCGICMKDMG